MEFGANRTRACRSIVTPEPVRAGGRVRVDGPSVGYRRALRCVSVPGTPPCGLPPPATVEEVRRPTLARRVARALFSDGWIGLLILSALLVVGLTSGLFPGR
jgi:hypothetical protein